MPCLEHFIENCKLCPPTGANSPEYQAPPPPVVRERPKPYVFNFGDGVAAPEGPVQPNPVLEESANIASGLKAETPLFVKKVTDSLAKSVLDQADRFAVAREDLAKVELEIVTLRAKLKIAEGRRRQAKHDLKVSRKEMTAALRPQKEDKNVSE